ncbi:hypothetical protein [Sphingomonas sp. PvP056]|uniref:hypothetical protein n=1 Tax=Sphingomonas sp. PvP056 TaxID=3156392 RepID=UPI003392ADA8
MTTPASEAHQCWSADQTAYLRNLDPEDRIAWAVLYQSAPVRTESGSTSHSLNFPVPIVSAYANEPEAVARRVVEILNRHWDEEPTQ